MLAPLLLAAAVLGPARTPADSVSADLLQQRETAAWRLIATLQSPFCPGLTLESCPSWYADSLRTEIRQRMARGESAARIRAELARDFGQQILGEPSWHGFDVTGWIGPAVVMTLSAALLALRLRCRAVAPATAVLRGRPDLELLPPTLAPEERARLEEDLARELAKE
jgi:cytochrome c-type biogenesis protein CcmH/NrfF